MAAATPIKANARRNIDFSPSGIFARRRAMRAAAQEEYPINATVSMAWRDKKLDKSDRRGQRS
jgi:hypothetical protein